MKKHPVRWKPVPLLLVLAAAAWPLLAWAINANTDPAYWVIRLGGRFSKWPQSAIPVQIEVSQNYLCKDGPACATKLGIGTAANNSALAWNDALAGEGVVASSFLQGCDSTSIPGTCNLTTYTPSIPDPTQGDQPGNLINSETGEANHTCVFPAYHVSASEGPLSAYVEYTTYSSSTGQPTGWNEFSDPEGRGVVVAGAVQIPADYSVTVAGNLYTYTTQSGDTAAIIYSQLDTAMSADPNVTATAGASRLELEPQSPGTAFILSVSNNLTTQGPATKVCALWVDHSVNTVSPSAVPNQFLPARNANGSLQMMGNLSNSIFVEEKDFSGATAGLVGPDSGVLALTLTWGYPGQIVEADVIMNANETASRTWSTSAVPPGSCAVPATHSDQAANGSGATADGTLCYRGDGTYGSVTPKIYMFENVLTHEMGHFVGLDHPCARYASRGLENDCNWLADSNGSTQTRISDTTMFWAANAGQTNKETVEDPDVDGLRYLYLPRGGGGGCDLSGEGGGLLEALLFLTGLGAGAALARYRRMKRTNSPARLACFLLVWAACWMAGAGEAHATSVEAQTSKALAKSADTVSQVKVKSVRTGVLPTGFPVQIYELEASDSIKGVAPGEITVPGGTVGGKTLHVAGAPVFEVGEEILLFSLKDSRGRHLVGGFMQGAKRIVRDKETGRARVRTEEPVSGGVLEAAPRGGAQPSAAAGPPELPPEMDLDDYKAYLRKALAE